MTTFSILLVDDEETEQILNGILLEDYLGEQHTLTKAYDGLEALEALENGLKVDCILLDINMPRMNGFGLLDKMQEKNLQPKVIMLTSSMRSSDKEKSLSYECVVDFFSKPLDKEKIEKLEILLSSS